MESYDLSISLVSHGNESEVARLLSDINKSDLYPLKVEVIVTQNIPGPCVELEMPRFQLVINKNPHRRGFGANHNSAFKKSSGRYFLVLNPDVRITNLDFVGILDSCKQNPMSILSPRVTDDYGNEIRSKNKFPSLHPLMRRMNKQHDTMPADTGKDYYRFPKWIPGAFMLFDRQYFIRLNGFNEKYFMYVEDAEICLLSHMVGGRVIIDTRFSISHKGRRLSRKNLNHFKWHILSLLRFTFFPQLKLRLGLVKNL